MFHLTVIARIYRKINQTIGPRNGKSSGAFGNKGHQAVYGKRFLSERIWKSAQPTTAADAVQGDTTGSESSASMQER